MANPYIESGFDTNDTNTAALPSTLLEDGYLRLQVAESKHINEIFKQLFAAANKSKQDGIWEWDSTISYNIGSIVSYGGVSFQSLKNANAATPLDDGINWYKIDLANYAKKNGTIATATALKTARNINGTSFNGTSAITTANWGTARNINGSSVNGSADVTTANWGTARNLTIGSSTKSVNGSANVAFSLAEIGADYEAAKSLSANGYMKFTNGLIIQWGSCTSGQAFPISFPNAALQAVVTQTTVTDMYQNLYISTLNTTTIAARSTTSTSIAFRWVAIGY